jgi:FkbH-like protein
MLQLKYTEILAANKKLSLEVTGVPYKITILSNVIVNSIKEILEYCLRSIQINPDISFGNYDNIVQDSQFVKDKNMVIVFYELMNVIDGFTGNFDGIDDDAYSNLKNRLISELEMTMNNLKDMPSVIINTFSAAGIGMGSSYRTKAESLAFELNEYLNKNKKGNVILFNLDKLHLISGIEKNIDRRMFRSSSAPYTLHFLKLYVDHLEHFILRNTGKLRKAIIFDCDNTLWKGIIGEDGPENINMKNDKEGISFRKVQELAVFLSKCGVLIGVCSKNNESDVLEVFRNHTDIILKEEHLVIRKINWNDKVSNLKEIAQQLNISLESLVFVDDSSFEVNHVREQIPEVLVLQVPSLAYEYPVRLNELVSKHFNLNANSEDVKKTAMYKEQFKREQAKETYDNLDEYLASLEIEISAEINSLNSISRISQITQKTNQFNLTTRRYTEGQITSFMENSDSHILSYTIKDKFGDNGLTAIAIVLMNSQTAIIDSFLMSCRIIGRNIEKVILNNVLEWLKQNGIKEVKSEFIPTKKNMQVRNFYNQFGFKVISEIDDHIRYSINTDDFIPNCYDYIKLEMNFNKSAQT